MYSDGIINQCKTTPNLPFTRNNIVAQMIRLCCNKRPPVHFSATLRGGRQTCQFCITIIAISHRPSARFCTGSAVTAAKKWGCSISIFFRLTFEFFRKKREKILSERKGNTPHKIGIDRVFLEKTVHVRTIEMDLPCEPCHRSFLSLQLLFDYGPYRFHCEIQHIVILIFTIS